MSNQKSSLWGEFSTPLYAATNSGAGQLNPALTDLFIRRSEQGDQYANQEGVLSKQVSIFESGWDLFKWPQQEVQTLKAFCMEHLWQMVVRANNYSLDEGKQLRVHTECWYHVTRFGGYISSHNHANNSWSGVYMVDPGDNNPDYPDSGVLSFKDPRQLALAYLDPGNVQLDRQFHLGSMNFAMQAGELMIFPSYLFHEVFPYMGQRPRITVAFNCKFTRPD